MTALEYSAPSVSKELLITFYPWYNFYSVLSLTVFISQLSFHSVATKTTQGFYRERSSSRLAVLIDMSGVPISL